MGLAFVNDRFIDEDKATIGIKDLAVRRGFGIFDFFRNAGLKPLFIDRHLDRFYASANRIGLKVPVNQDRLKEICTELIKKNNLPDSGVRLILTGGYSPNGYTPADPNLIITNEPLKLVDEETRNKGVSVISHDYQREFPEVKTINYFTGIMLQKKAEASGAFDVLYHFKGDVLEFTRSNIFAVLNNGTIVTPKNDILLGITRGSVIKLASDKYKVEERNVTMAELLEASEVFMTGTTKRVLPVIKIDDRVIGSGIPGEVSKDLYKLFYEFEMKQS